MKKIINKNIFYKLIISLSLVFVCMLYSIKKSFAASNIDQATLYSTLEDNYSWVVIHNQSSSSIKVGHMTVGTGKSVTLDTWANIKEHKGIWYNLEGYYTMAKHASVSTYINATQLSTMNKKINSIDRWGILINCSSFATDIWNSISHTNASSGLVNTPSGLASSIKSKFSSEYVTNRAIPSKSKHSIYYHTLSDVKQCSNPTGGKSSSGSKSLAMDNIDNYYANSFIDFD